MKAARMLVLVLAALAVLPFAASANPSSEQPAATGGGTAARGPVTMTVAGVQVADTSGYPAGMDEKKNVWLDWYQSALNVTIQTKWVVPQAQADDKMNAQIAAGDIPDLLKVNTNQFQLLLKNDLIADLTSAYQRTANQWYKEYAKMDNGIGLKMASQGGKLYGLPYYNDAVYTNSIWIRRDWLKKYNLAVPKTMDELANAARVFANGDPDGNGKQDTLGLGFWMSKSIDTLEAVLTGFAAYPQLWVAGPGGKAQRSAVSANAGTALAWLAKQYQAGLLSPEFATMTDAQVAEAIVNGRCGITTWPFWAAYWALGNNKKVDPNADWISIYPTVDGKSAKIPTAKKIGLYFAVRKGFTYPEIAVEMANKFAEATLGPDKVAQTLKFIMGSAGENYWQFSQVYFWPSINQDVEPFVDALAKKDKGLCPPFRLGNWDALKYIESGDVGGYASWLSFGPESQYLQNIKLLKAGSIEDGVYFGAGTPTMARVGGDLDKILLQGYAKIIAGDAKTTFDAVVKEWLAAGGQKITDEVNAEIAANK